MEIDVDKDRMVWSVYHRCRFVRRSTLVLNFYVIIRSNRCCDVDGKSSARHDDPDCMRPLRLNGRRPADMDGG